MKTSEEYLVTQTYLVPVREKPAGTLTLQTGRLMSGERVGLAFSSEATLLAVMGPSQHWIRLAAEPLHEMLAPLGVEAIRIDPRPAGRSQAWEQAETAADSDTAPGAATQLAAEWHALDAARALSPTLRPPSKQRAA
jgi:hypothetical protein